VASGGKTRQCFRIMNAPPTELHPTPHRADWADAMARVRYETLEQSWAYGAAAEAAGLTVQRWRLLQGGAVIGLVQVFGRQTGPFRLQRIVRGPLFAPGVAADTRRAALGQIAAAYPGGPFWRRQFLWWLPELPGGSESEQLMAGLGLRQMVTGWSSVRIDLSPPPGQLRARLDGKWRNALKASEKAPIRVETAWDDEAFAALMQAHDAQRIRKRFLGPDSRFYRAVAAADGDGDSAHLFTARIAGRMAAGLLILRHGRGATYAAGWSGEAGRLVRAHHRLLWQAMLHLKAAGVTHFDLGGANTEEGAGVARFKLGLNGEVFTLAGSFL